MKGDRIPRYELALMRSRARHRRPVIVRAVRAPEGETPLSAAELEFGRQRGLLPDSRAHARPFAKAPA